MTFHRVGNRRSLRAARYIVGAVAAAALFVASDADALPGRTLCPAGAMVNNNLPSASLTWTASDQCQVKATGTAAWNGSSVVYGSISFPLQTGSASVTVYPVVRAYGGDGHNSAATQFSAAGYAYDSSGNLSAATNVYYTSGATATHQDLFVPNSPSVTVPVGGAFTVNFAAQKGAGVDIVTARWSGAPQPP
jgi:hypothetical protein